MSKTKMTPAEGKLTILQDPKHHQLYKVSKALSKVTPEAVQYFIDVMRDHEADPKRRDEAAKFLAEKGIAVADMMAKDQLTRLVAEVKVQALSIPKQQMKDIAEEDDTPKVLFSPDRILSVEGKDTTEIKVEPEPLDVSRVTHL